MQSIYKINIMNWSEHNPKHKRTYKKFMLSNGFLNDPKVAELKPMEVILFIHLLCVASESATSQLQISVKSLPKQLRMGDKSLTHHLKRLESFQLLTIEKEPLIELKELKRREVKERKVHSEIRKPQSQAVLFPAAAPTKVGQLLVAHYCELWKNKYFVEAPIRPQDCKALKSFGEANGVPRSKELLTGYFKIPDSWVIKKRHDLQTFLNNLSAVAAFVESGKVVTNSELRQLDQAVTNQNTLEALREGKI